MTAQGWEFHSVPLDGSRTGAGVLRVIESRRRRLVLVVVAAVLMGAGLADSYVGRGSSGAVPGAAVALAASTATGALVPSPGSQSSAWFCVGGAPSGTSAPVMLELINPGARPVDGTIQAVSTTGSPRSVSVQVPPRSQLQVAPPQIASTSWVAATVLLAGGGVAVSEVVTGPLGWSTSPCASSTSAHWYFAHGSTASGATLSLCLYNPLATDAVVDVALDSPTAGVLEPPAFEGIPVPARSLVVENLGDHLLDAASVGTEVSTSSGTVVAAELQSTPQPGGGGSSLLLGVPSTSEEWDFPQNVDPAGGSVVFDVFNPSGAPARVSVGIGLSGGQAEPLSMEVAAHSVSRLEAEQKTRIPTGSPYELSFTSRTSAGIVVDRELSAPSGSLSPQTGEVGGVAFGATRSLVPSVAAPGTSLESLVISDLTTRPVRVTVYSATNRVVVDGLRHRLVLPHRPLELSPAPGSGIGESPLMVVSSGQVAVEADVAPAGAVGEVVLPVFPLS